jgi:hypothetical protein
MRARFVVGSLLAAVFAAGCAAVLGLDAGEPLDAPFEAGSDVTTVPPDTGTTDAPNVGDGSSDGGCGPNQKSCSGCQSVDDPGFGCTPVGCTSCSALFPEAGQVTGYLCPGCTIGSCVQNYKNCDQDAANGCESNGQTDPKNCGKCGTVCQSPNNYCVGGGCTADCGPPNTVCDAACVNTTGDPYNCNGCGIACPGSPNSNGVATCSGSTCGYSCNNNYSRCPIEAGCYNTSIDQTHCGPSCQYCNPPPSGHGTVACSLSICQITCDGGYTLSGGDCILNGVDSGPDSGPCVVDAALCMSGGSFCGAGGSCCGCRCNLDQLCCLQAGALCNTGQAGECCNNTCVPGSEGGSPDGQSTGHCK